LLISLYRKEIFIIVENQFIYELLPTTENKILSPNMQSRDMFRRDFLFINQ
jgi:hypothetical protein